MRSKDSIFRVCFRGIYSCYWKPSRQSKERCACFWFTFLSLITILALGWMYICFVAYNDHSDVNWMAFKNLKIWVNWYMAVIIISAILAIYSLLLLLFSLFQFAIKEPLDLHWLHKVLLFVGLSIVVSGTAGMILKWKEEWPSILLSQQATAPFLQLAAVVALTMISWFVFHSYYRAKTAVSKFLIIGALAVISVAIFLSPLMIHSPCLTDSLPQKPTLVGHRGAPVLAPENTIMSFNKSVECNVAAFETDIQLSKDKKPFLMHDTKPFLMRTTNVKNQTYKDSSNITWSQLQELNAGEWFVKTDPFWSVSLLSEEDKALASNQRVPLLSQLLELAKKTNISLIFDIKDCSKNNCRYNCQDILEPIKHSNISHYLIWWLPNWCKDVVQKQYPGFRLVYDNVTEMREQGGHFLNLKYSAQTPEQLSKLRNENVTVNLWVVNERWLFSLLWCSGASSVTTNNCHLLKDMSKPDWHLTPYVYKIIWITVDITSFLLMIILFLLQRQRNSRSQYFLGQRERTLPLLSRKS